MKHPHPSTVVGLDVGDRKVHVFAMDVGTGEVLAEGSVPTTRTAVRRSLRSLGKARVVLEVGTHSRWLSVLLEEMGHEVLVANARKLRMFYAGTNKQDRLDARKLAMLGHAEPQLLYPVRHRGQRAHEDLAVVRARSHLVRQRTATINLRRGMVKAAGERLPVLHRVARAHQQLHPHHRVDGLVRVQATGAQLSLDELRAMRGGIDELRRKASLAAAA